MDRRPPGSSPLVGRSSADEARTRRHAGTNATEVLRGNPRGLRWVWLQRMKHRRNGRRLPWSGSGLRFVMSLSLLFGACANNPSPPAGSPAATAQAPLPPLPRSSIAAVVLHREELGLSDDQVRDLELRDQEREKEDAAIRDELEKRRRQAEDARGAASNGGASAGGPGSSSGGQGMRGGGMRGRSGGRTPRPPGPPSPSHEQSLDDRTDANDTKAYLDIEDRLNAEQLEKAREIASDFRARLYERRESLRNAAGTSK